MQISTSLDESRDGPYTFVGVHVLVEVYGVDQVLLDDEAALTTQFETALREADVTICLLNSVRFEPCGVTIFAVLSESHASLHAYPELGCAFLDVFTCGTTDLARRAVNHLVERLGAATCCIQEINRGGPYPQPKEKQ